MSAPGCVQAQIWARARGNPDWIDEQNLRFLARIHDPLKQWKLNPYAEIQRPTITLPERAHNPDYLRLPVPQEMRVPEIY